MMMIKRGGVVAVAGAAVVVGGAMLSGTAVAVSAGGGDGDGVMVWRAPGQVEALTGEVWTMRGCAYGLFPPRIGMSCRYEVVT
ncbi:hypothetical protein [Streptodolium elevatio]